MDMSMDMSYAHLALMALVRGLLVAGALLSIGAAGFYSLVFRPALSALKNAPGPLQSDGELRARRLAAWAAVLLAAANVIALFHEGAMMSGRSITDVWPVLPVVLLKTHWGKVWVGRSVILAALAGVLIVRLPLAVVLFVSAGAAASISLVSHAVDAGNISLPVAFDAVHIISFSIWIGGLVALRVLAGAAAPGFEGVDGKKRFLYEILRRFSPLAMVSVFLILATGLYAAYLHSPDFLAIRQTVAYGKILQVKHVFAIAAVALGGVTRFFVMPGLRKAKTGERPLKFLWVAITLELVFAALVLACAALLSQETPPFLG